jgi:hypothetical protein
MPEPEGARGGPRKKCLLIDFGKVEESDVFLE